MKIYTKSASKQKEEKLNHLLKQRHRLGTKNDWVQALQSDTAIKPMLSNEHALSLVDAFYQSDFHKAFHDTSKEIIRIQGSSKRRANQQRKHAILHRLFGKEIMALQLFVK